MKAKFIILSIIGMSVLPAASADKSSCLGAGQSWPSIGSSRAESPPLRSRIGSPLRPLTQAEIHRDPFSTPPRQVVRSDIRKAPNAPNARRAEAGYPPRVRVVDLP